MTSTNNTYDDVTMVQSPIWNGTLLHDGKTFEDRFLTQRSIDSINRMHGRRHQIRGGDRATGQHRLLVRAEASG